MSKETIGGMLRRLRTENKLTLRKVAAMVDIDVAILSKMERGERRLTKKLVQKLATIYKYNEEDLIVLFLSDKVVYEIGDDALAIKALHVAEETVTYKTKVAKSKADIVKIIKSVIKADGRIASAWLFGSVARNEATTESDVDIMVELNQKRNYSLFDLMDIAHSIEQKINRKVDLVEKGYLKDFALTTAERDLIKIYG